MKLLNLGCGTKTSDKEGVINIDWSIYLRLKKNPVLRRIAPIILDGQRLERFRSLPSNIIVHDLSRGIPYESGSVDAIYHSHFLEHLDRSAAPPFLIEARRVLKQGGIHRIVVPDFARLCRAYVDHLDVCRDVPSERESHDLYVAAILEQSVRHEAHGTSKQGCLRRSIENLFLGDARQRGETHQWMYDRFTLGVLLLQTGYLSVRTHNYDTSTIPDWNSYGLDVDRHGNPHKPGSLYIEAVS